MIPQAMPALPPFEILGNLGLPVPLWPEASSSDSELQGWVSTGISYAKAIRSWRTELLSLTDSSKSIVCEVFSVAIESRYIDPWDRLVYEFASPAVYGTSDYRLWQTCYAVTRSKQLCLSQSFGAALESARLGDLGQLLRFVECLTKEDFQSNHACLEFALAIISSVINSDDFEKNREFIVIAFLHESAVSLLRVASQVYFESGFISDNSLPQRAYNLHGASLLLQAQACLNKVLRNSMLKRAFLPSGYIKRTQYFHFDDTKNKDEWQKEVYEAAAAIATRFKMKDIVDFGCGSGYKLVKYFSEFNTVGIELECNLKFLKTRYPSRQWLSLDTRFQSLPYSDMIICSDVIEHLVDPVAFLEYLSQQQFRLLIISTPERGLVYHGRESLMCGPPGNRAHTMEWAFNEFNHLISCFFEIEDHWICNESQFTQVIACWNHR